MEAIPLMITIISCVIITCVTLFTFMMKNRKYTLPPDIILKLEIHDKDIEKGEAERKTQGERIATLEANSKNTNDGILRIEKKLEALNTNIISFLQQEVVELKNQKAKK